jgi:hypothetical protein
LFSFFETERQFSPGLKTTTRYLNNNDLYKKPIGNLLRIPLLSKIAELIVPQALSFPQQLASRET